MPGKPGDSNPSSSERHLQQLSERRRFHDRDYSLSFLRDTFKREVEKPYKQLVSIVEVWERLVPAALLPHMRLDGFSRGVLHVSVDSASIRYELDRLLRMGLQTQLIEQHKGPALRRVQVSVGVFDEEGQAGDWGEDQGGDGGDGRERGPDR